jgi:hypothetical protein
MALEAPSLGGREAGDVAQVSGGVLSGHLRCPGFHPQHRGGRLSQ